MRFLLFLVLFCSFTFASEMDLEDEFQTSKEENIFDPLHGYNELMTSFNDTFYEYVLRPTAQGYAYIVPEPARQSLSNAFNNLFFPIRFVNNLLQLKFQNSAEELGRFMINSTLGVAGLFDVASSEFHLKPHPEDLGQTLGYYGVGNGFHVVLPVWGASNVRDIVGLAGDTWLNPLYYIESRDANLLGSHEESWYVAGAYLLNETSLHVEEYDAFKKDAIELYPFLRNIYESRRNKLISE